MTSHKAVTSKRAALQILPCTVSQLLSAPQVSRDTFAICDWELNQVSVVGIIRGFASFVTNIQYSVDDMTGPALNVKQWVSEDCVPMMFTSPGTYVKVIGSLRNFSGQRSLLAMTIRCIRDPNEITSHMLEVVQAHMQFFGKVFDVNMNTTAASLSGRDLSQSARGHLEGTLPNGLSTIQGQGILMTLLESWCAFHNCVPLCPYSTLEGFSAESRQFLVKVLHVIRRFSVRDNGISLHDLKTQLSYLSIGDIRTSLVLLVNEGHIFSPLDEHHFKAAEQ